jgi:hypothetical protein
MAVNGRDSGNAQFVDPRSFGLFKAAYSVKETLDLLSIGRTKFYELVGQGDLRINKLGTKSLVYVTDIVALLTRLSGTVAEN